jgi:metal-responsive CopG/Arc/MetJ family transcriptional regulator
MKKVAKMAVSIPADTYRMLERTRRRLKTTRSALVAEALEEWLRKQELGEADRRYAEGYRRHPETATELAATLATAAAAMADWEPWK